MKTPKCEIHEIELHKDCPQCGAPNCCLKCCNEATEELREYERSEAGRAFFAALAAVDPE